MYNGNYIISGSKVLIHILYCTVQLSTKAGWMVQEKKNQAHQREFLKKIMNHYNWNFQRDWGGG